MQSPPRSQERYRPRLTQAGLDPCRRVEAVDEHGKVQEREIAGERPLTLYLDKREIVTLMTLGSHPELLVLGYLRNQGILSDPEEVAEVQVDWETESAVVVTRAGVSELDEKLGTRTVTTGCGQGTVFGKLMDHLERSALKEPVEVRQSEIYGTLDAINQYNEVYRRAGAVHGCALCRDQDIEMFVEDVGRHNAVDAIAGHMWLEGMPGRSRIFYTTGRLTSEMVMKVAQMGIPTLLSRSGITEMGLDLGRRLGITLIARAKGTRFQVYNGADQVVFDDEPTPYPKHDRGDKARADSASQEG
ncbi:formate dehydrogenase accessory sulfurtransferase FdhD [Thiohalorhabdus methylotrophus]|uniref:Sulfur carrier protein FdhD n=1 Tax=Thiohalorhabdus methylotrophus TaxID=3242694 RepID=A0ABV4TW88_9GAMM